MKKKVKTKTNKNLVEKSSISRRDAIRKISYAAFASSTMLLLLNNPTKVHASSPGEDDPGDPGGGWDFGTKDKSDDWDDDWDDYYLD